MQKNPRAIKEQRKKWRENSKRYRQRTFQAIQIEAVINKQDVSNSLDKCFTIKEDPIKVIRAVDQSVLESN